MSESRRLYRSRSTRVVAGVCGGLAEYFKIDPILVRVLWVVFLLSFGTGLLAYILLWLFVPEEPLES